MSPNKANLLVLLTGSVTVELTPDTSRLCERCGERPRWSPAAICKLCDQCGRPAKHVSRRCYQYDAPGPLTGTTVVSAAELYRRRKRYHDRIAAGASADDARRCSLMRSSPLCQVVLIVEEEP